MENTNTNNVVENEGLETTATGAEETKTSV